MISGIVAPPLAGQPSRWRFCRRTLSWTCSSSQRPPHAAAAAAAAAPAQPATAVMQPLAWLKSSHLSPAAHPALAAQPSLAAQYLLHKGIEPAELQRQCPEAFPHLTHPLAQLLVDVHAAAAAAAAADLSGEYGGSGSSSAQQAPRPAELLRRIWLLHSQAGLPAGDVQQLWQHDPSLLCFPPGEGWPKLEALADIVAWLQRDLGFLGPQACSVWAAQLSTYWLPADRLRANLQGVLLRCPLSPEQQRAFVASAGILLTSDYSALLAKLDSILAEAPGAEPLLAAVLEMQEPGGNAALFRLDALLRKVAVLRKFGFTREQLSGVVTANPQALLNCSLLGCDPLRSCERGVKPILEALERALGGRQEVVQAVCANPGLLTWTPAVTASRIGELHAHCASCRQERSTQQPGE